MKVGAPCRFPDHWRRCVWRISDPLQRTARYPKWWVLQKVTPASRWSFVVFYIFDFWDVVIHHFLKQCFCDGLEKIHGFNITHVMRQFFFGCKWWWETDAIASWSQLQINCPPFFSIKPYSTLQGTRKHISPWGKSSTQKVQFHCEGKKILPWN